MEKLMSIVEKKIDICNLDHAMLYKKIDIN